MKKLNKTTKIVIAVCLTIVICVPCGFLIALWTSGKKADIVVTMYAQYDWVKQVLGDNPSGYTVKYLMDKGVDPHSYEPSMQDAMEIKQSKLFIYVGDTAETKIAPILASNPNPNRRQLALMTIVEDELHEHEEDDDCDDGCGSAHTGDEHVWLSLKFAKRFVSAIANTLGQMDTTNSNSYKSNADDYIAELERLDKDYTDVFINRGHNKPLLFADRFPFIYLLSDYGYTERNTHWIVPQIGCGAFDPPMSMIFDLRAKIASNELDYILILENQSSEWKNFADAVAQSTPKLILDSIQSVKANQLKNTSYLAIMTQNLVQLKKALGVSS